MKLKEKVLLDRLLIYKILKEKGNREKCNLSSEAYKKIRHV